MRTVISTKIGSNYKSEKNAFIKKLARQKSILLLLIPGLLWFAAFRYLPLHGIFYAFTNFGAAEHWSFVGLSNFRTLFSLPDFWQAFGNTLIISFLNLSFGFVFSLSLALLINELYSLRLKRIIQLTIYIPYFFSWVVVGSIFVTLLNPVDGVVAAICGMLGIEPVYMMISEQWFRVILVGSSLWKEAGFGTVIYIATLATISPELYEAAEIDGANHWQKLVYVTLPSISSTIAIVLFLSIAGVLGVFEQVFVMYNPAVYSVSDVLGTFAYRTGLVNGQIGLAGAISLFVSFVSTSLVIGTNRLSKIVLGESVL